MLPRVAFWAGVAMVAGGSGLWLFATDQISSPASALLGGAAILLAVGAVFHRFGSYLMVASVAAGAGMLLAGVSGYPSAWVDGAVGILLCGGWEVLDLQRRVRARAASAGGATVWIAPLAVLHGWRVAVLAGAWAGFILFVRTALSKFSQWWAPSRFADSAESSSFSVVWMATVSLLLALGTVALLVPRGSRAAGDSARSPPAPVKTVGLSINHLSEE